MNIVFNVLNSGLGNQGGSRTLLLCQKTLEELGHRCDVVGIVDNFTWFKHKPLIKTIPKDTDIIIATACTTVESTLKSNVPIKAWYIRAHETWTMQEEKLIILYKSGLINIVNSNGLKNKLKEFGIKSEVIYQGIDFEWWKDLNVRPINKIRIGCLHTIQERKRWCDFVEIVKILGTEKYEYVGIGSSRPKETFLTEFICNGTAEELCKLYSSCHIWFAPTESEGLFNVAMEAALCGCLLVCSNHSLNGMISDYAFNNKTAMIYDFGNLDMAIKLIKDPKWNLVESMIQHIKNNIGTRLKNMQGLVEVLNNDCNVFK